MKDKSNMSVVIVDDEKIIRQSLTREFNKRGFENISEAKDGAELLSFLKEKKKFSFYLIDLKLPDISGIELLKTIKKNSSTAKVIILTGFGDVSNCRDCFYNGAIDYFTKPLDMNKLFFTIESILKNNESHANINNFNLDKNIDSEILNCFSIVFNEKNDFKKRENYLLKLSEFNNNIIIPVLIDYLSVEKNVSLKQKTIYVLGKSEDLNIYKEMLRILKDNNEDPPVRMAAVSALHALGKTDIIAPFLSSLKHSKENIIYPKPEEKRELSRKTEISKVKTSQSEIQKKEKEQQQEKETPSKQLKDQKDVSKKTETSHKLPSVSKTQDFVPKKGVKENIKIDVSNNIMYIFLSNFLSPIEVRTFIRTLNLDDNQNTTLYIDISSLDSKFVKSIAIILSKPSIDIVVKKNTLNLLKQKKLFVSKNKILDKDGNRLAELNISSDNSSEIASFMVNKPKYEFNEKNDEQIKRKIARDFYRLDLKKFIELYETLHTNSLNMVFDLFNVTEASNKPILLNQFVRDGVLHNPKKSEHLKKFFPKFIKFPLKMLEENSNFIFNKIRFKLLPLKLTEDNIISAVIVMQCLLYILKINYVVIGDTFSPKIFDNNIAKKCEKEVEQYLDGISRYINNIEDLYKKSAESIDNISKNTLGKKLLPIIYTIRQDFSELLFKYFGVELNEKSEAVSKGLLTDSKKALIQSYKKFLLDKDSASPFANL